jgi:hypothetical protein
MAKAGPDGRRLIEGLARDSGALAAGKQPADDRREQRHADDDDRQVRDRDARQRRGDAAVE